MRRRVPVALDPVPRLSQDLPPGIGDDGGHGHLAGLPGLDREGERPLHRGLVEIVVAHAKTIAQIPRLGYCEAMKASQKDGSGKAGARSDAGRLRALFDAPPAEPERLAKKIAAAGFCSRRDAEKWIADGRVTVNGAVHVSPAFNAGPDDLVTVDGKPLEAAGAPRLWRYYKPRGLVVSHRDEKGRRTIFESLPEGMPRVVSVGRLDLDSEGLVLLTNSGELARHLELPSTGWIRKYRVRVRGKVDAGRLGALEGGITLEGVSYRGIKAAVDRQAASNAWLTMALREGKNREIRRIMEHLGHPVSRLIRVSFGPFTLGDLEEGGMEEVRRAVLRDQLGLERGGGDGGGKATGRKASHAHHQRKKTRHRTRRA